MTWRDWWFLNRPWASAQVIPRPPLAPRAPRRLILRASFLRVTVELSFPWRPYT